MNIDVLSYLSEEEIKEICTEEIRNVIRIKLSSEEEVTRIIGNAAYYKAWAMFDQELTDEHKEIIINGIEKIINEPSSFNIFRRHWQTDKPTSKASLIVEETIKTREVDIINKVNEVVDSTLNNDNSIYETFVERFMDNMWSGFKVKFEKED